MCTSSEAATTDAANATVAASDAASAVDAGVVAAQAVLTAQASAVAASGTTATTVSASGGETAKPDAVANVPVGCPGGGGGAILSITGGTVASVLNEPLFQNHCQCLDCQHKSSGHGSYLTFARQGVKQTGDAKLWDMVGDIGNVKTRGFCPTCESPGYMTFAAQSAEDPTFTLPYVLRHLCPAVRPSSPPKHRPPRIPERRPNA